MIYIYRKREIALNGKVKNEEIEKEKIEFSPYILYIIEWEEGRIKGQVKKFHLAPGCLVIFSFF